MRFLTLSAAAVVNSRGAYLAKIDLATGAVLWRKENAELEDVTGTHATVVADGGSEFIFVSGTYNGLPVPTTGAQRFFTAGYDTDGNLLPGWPKLSDAGTPDQQMAALVGGLVKPLTGKAVIVVGSATKPNMPQTTEGLNNTELVVIAYDLDGKTLWTFRKNLSSGGSRIEGVLADPSENVIWLSGVVDLFGNRKAFVARLRLPVN